MVGLNDNVKKRVSLDGFTSDLVLAQELNEFYSRFDVHDFNNEKHNTGTKSASSSSF